ncbi:MAG: hypothetical protein WC467_02430 [Patescibacteria group bacterium]
MPTFLCNGEELPLDQISKKKVTSVTINYLSAPQRVKVAGIMGLLGKSKTVQEEKELIINDEKGIIIYFVHGQTVITIRFWDEKEWNNIVDYDQETLFKNYVMTLVAPYLLNFHIGNLKSLSWN